MEEMLLHQFYLLLKSSLAYWYLFVRLGTEFIDLCLVKSGKPQGNILGPVLHLLYNEDFPTICTITVTSSFCGLMKSTKSSKQVINVTIEMESQSSSKCAMRFRLLFQIPSPKN